ncbi:MAG: tripartite tricarboxylate transporter TctB family protein [Opitutaceae bacterium]|nr:tripartite tricarboxylate transporter TctB family protein [Opitutaceae bacterium]
MAGSKSNIADQVAAGGFFGLGFFLFVSGAALPDGVGLLPKALGLVMLGLSIGLYLQGRKNRASAGFSIGHLRLLASVTALTAVYLLLWGFGWFPLRTFVYLAVLLWILGESWKRGLAVSAALSSGVTAAFQYGLQISLE